MISFHKYYDKPEIRVLDNEIVEFNGTFSLYDQGDNYITMSGYKSKYIIFGSCLEIIAISTPKTIIKGKIERLEIL